MDNVDIISGIGVTTFDEKDFALITLSDVTKHRLIDKSNLIRSNNCASIARLDGFNNDFHFQKVAEMASSE